jgi:predicted nucleic acid-binding Zn ribbon protein
MEELLSLLPIILQRADYQEEVCQQAVFAVWHRAVGEAISMNCVPFRLHDKRLIILTSSQIWKTQLQKMASEIIFKIDRILGAPLVTYIEYRVDAKQVAAHQQRRSEIRYERLEELMKELESDASLIADPELRRIFLRAASKSLARRKGIHDGS